VAYAAFAAHSSPLGLEYFDRNNEGELRDSFLVGLHGSTKEHLNRGYRVVRLRGLEAKPAVPENFIDGFLEGKRINGRPCDILNLGHNSFLLTDDYAGVVYYVYKK
jgi:glucose/arabinose dehydrogenase